MPALIDRLWAKLDRGQPTARHSLLPHLLDVGLMAQALWDAERTKGFALAVQERLGLSSEGQVRQWVGFLAASHDIGKVHPCFQAKDSEFTEASQACQTLLTRDMPHGEVSARILYAYFRSLRPADYVSAQGWATVSGGHHGIFLSADMSKPRGRTVGVWAEMQQRLLTQLAESFPFAYPQRWDDAIAIYLAGLISVADWIASDPIRFPFPQTKYSSVEQYVRERQPLASAAAQDLQWRGPERTRKANSFASVFPRIATPRPLQLAVEQVVQDHPDLRLLIVEAPTGEGKTEAALYAAEAWAAAGKTRGLFFALPTMATSNQMFDRLKAFLADTAPGSQLQLLHGHALLLDSFRDLLTPVKPNEGEGRRVVAESWFTFRKRGLLAPFGVGTIDQILRAALRHRHVFVRLKGLSGKTVIIDEVHAYDVYMSTLLERLIQWLIALECRVVLLSATLPESKRQSLLAAAFPAASNFPTSDQPYPLLSAADPSGRHIHLSFAAASPDRRVSLRRCGTTDDALDAVLDPLLIQGGCAAIICNTVRRAQEIFAKLQARSEWQEHLTLLHSRFRLEDRHAIERKLLGQFGPNGDRPTRHIVVATQILEQSLDVDFDVMISDLCPIDLIIQRIGRLHRHNGRLRPAPFRTPTLYWTAPNDGTLERGWLHVYEEFVLRKTAAILDPLTEIKVPSDVRPLIEAVYGEHPSSAGDDFPQARERMERHRLQMSTKAAELYLPELPPTEFSAITSKADDDQLAKTRLGDFDFPVVCLFPDEADLADDLTAAGVRALITKSLGLRRFEVADEAWDSFHQPARWTDHAVLQGYGLVLLDAEGRGTLPGGGAMWLCREQGLLLE